MVQIEQSANGIHEWHTQQTIAQMPQVTCPQPFGFAALDQLSEDRVDARSHPSQDRTPIVGRSSTGLAKRSKKDDADLLQRLVELGQPIVAISQQPSPVPCLQVPQDL